MLEHRIHQLAASIDQRGQPLGHQAAQKIVDDWLAHHEWGLALDSLLDTVLEHEIPITEDEYDQFLQLGQELQQDIQNWKTWLTPRVILI